MQQPQITLEPHRRAVQRRYLAASLVAGVVGILAGTATHRATGRWPHSAYQAFKEPTNDLLFHWLPTVCLVIGLLFTIKETLKLIYQ
jgi:hypothetical protein